MNDELVDVARIEAKRFLEKLKAYGMSDKLFYHCPERAAMIRASLDLTKALARMRRGG